MKLSLWGSQNQATYSFKERTLWNRWSSNMEIPIHILFFTFYLHLDKTFSIDILAYPNPLLCLCWFFSASFFSFDPFPYPKVCLFSTPLSFSFPVICTYFGIPLVLISFYLLLNFNPPIFSSFLDASISSSASFRYYIQGSLFSIHLSISFSSTLHLSIWAPFRILHFYFLCSSSLLLSFQKTCSKLFSFPFLMRSSHPIAFSTLALYLFFLFISSFPIYPGVLLFTPSIYVMYFCPTFSISSHVFEPHTSAP